MSDRDNLYQELILQLKRLHATEAILTDLIAELREISYETDNPWTVAYSAVDRAEQRLKEVQGE